MLTLESLEMLLSIDENELLDNLVLALLATPQLAAFLEQHPRMKAALLHDLPEWKASLKQRLRATVAPADLEREFTCYQNTQTIDNLTFQSRIPHIVDTLQTVSLHHQLMEAEKEILLDELQQRLTLTGKLEAVLAENETAAGRLWDLSAGKFIKTELQTLINFCDFLQKQPSLQRLAERLGRSRETKSILSTEAPREAFRVMVREPDTVPEQVDGIHQSDDILRLLPAELGAMGIKELEYEFYGRLLERRLLTYRLQGESWHEKVIEHPVSHQQNEQQPRGPFIVCVDTSGSMGGFNERCAKAFCLALMRVALADNRRCYIMLFATDIEQATRFLGQSFRGGTDMAACMSALLDKLEDEVWHDADAVMISDFIAQRLPEETVQRVRQRQQQHHLRFHAVAMSQHGKPGILHIFDHIWHVDTGLK